MSGTRVSSYHAAPHPRGWSVRKTGGKRALAVFASSREAWRDARRRAEACGGIAWLHDAGGRICTRLAYGEHPSLAEKEGV